MPRTRQLAAIMFTDIKGYTALMQEDEGKAIRAREKHRRVFNATTERYRGRILQYYGDGTLSIFDSAIDAVRCGIELQKGFQETPPIPVRIGIHTGDIIFSEEEIIGDSVNVASRIESLAVPGSVFISDKVFDEIKNQDSIQAIFLKSVIFKNIKKPIEVYAIANKGLSVPKPDELTGKTAATSPEKAKQEPQEAASPAKAPDNILATKLFIPPTRPQYVVRPRLIEKLDQGIMGKLSLISAPAGFGKTSLVSHWIAQSGRASTWFSLDSIDGEPSRFLKYFVAALQKISPQTGEQVLSLLQFPPLPPIDTLLTALINEIAHISQPFFFVLDDYHVIDNKVIDDALSFLLDHQPPQMHMVITTREDPNLPLPRLRVRGQLTELRAKDLRFTQKEASSFLNQRMDLQLSKEDLNSLESRTEGWIAGLQMAAISLQGRSDSSQFIQDFRGSHRFVLDYLVEEVLQSQSEEIHSFLLQTSIVDKLCGSLCDAITGRLDGNQVLESIERGNLFIVALDDQRHWYRFHHLFADVLRANSSKKAASEVPTLHGRASVWFEQEGFKAEAIHHAFKAKNYERAAELLEFVWPEMDAVFQTKTWLNWAEQVPEALASKRPVLSVSYAWAFLNAGNLDMGNKWLKNAEQGFEIPQSQIGVPPSPILQEGYAIADKEAFFFLPSSISTARAYISQAMGDIPGSVTHAQHALDNLAETEYFRRGPSSALLGLAHWANGELAEAYTAISDAMEHFKQLGSYTFAVSGTFGLADINMAQGSLDSALKTYDSALQLVEQNPQAKIKGISELYLGLGKIACEQGDLDSARQHVQKSIDLGRKEALPDWPYRLALIQAKMEEVLGNPEKAITYLDKAEQLYYPSPLPYLRPVAAVKAQIWAREGNLSKAKSWLNKAQVSLNDALSYMKEFEQLTMIRIHLAEYKAHKEPNSLQPEIQFLERLLTAANKGKRMGSVLEILIVQALAYQALGEQEAALNPLEAALQLAEPQDYVSIFTIEGEAMVQLLHEVANRERVKSYAKKLITLVKTKRSHLSQSLIEPLSLRELEVLGLIAGGHSNKEISEQLFLSLSTIKGHNQHIFEKLGVKRRTEAVARGRELGII